MSYFPTRPRLDVGRVSLRTPLHTLDHTHTLKLLSECLCTEAYAPWCFHYFRGWFVHVYTIGTSEIVLILERCPYAPISISMSLPTPPPLAWTIVGNWQWQEKFILQTNIKWSNAQLIARGWGGGEWHWYMHYFQGWFAHAHKSITIGTSETVLIREASLFQRCPFHCI